MACRYLGRQLCILVCSMDACKQIPHSLDCMAAILLQLEVTVVVT